MWKWIKIPKAIALLAFVLPWLTVSCSGTQIVRAAGWELAFGRAHPVMPTASGNGMTMSATPTTSQELNIWLIAALAVIVVGLVIALLRQSRSNALGVAATSAASLVLIWIGTQRYGKSAILAQASKGHAPDANDQFGQNMAAAMIQVDWEIGFWLALGALFVAGVMAMLVYAGREMSFGSGGDSG